jgi:hypothetical protein
MELLILIRFRITATPTAVASFPYTATQPGTYVFTVTDSRGCPATSNTITVTPKQRQHILRLKPILCNGLNNGTITVTASRFYHNVYPCHVLSTATTFTTLKARIYLLD